jgi:multidrug resistance efflux pump
MARSNRLSATKDAQSAASNDETGQARILPSDVTALPSGDALGGQHFRLRDAGRDGIDVAGALALLKEAFEKPHEADLPARAWAAGVRDLARRAWTNQGRLLKTLLGLLIVVAAGWIPVRALLETTSTEAVINARLITLRAPIEGEIAPLPRALTVGTELQTGAPLLRIVNRRADHGRVDDLHRLIGQLESERVSLTAKRDDLTALHADLSGQTSAFREGRIRQLEARVLELQSEIAAAEATREEAARTLARVKPLADSGAMTRASFEKAGRDAIVAAETHAALRHRLTGIEVELAALKQGTFIGDSYNDRPRSAQRADEVAQRLSEVDSDLLERQTRLASLRADMREEEKRYSDQAAAQLLAPVRGSVWEILTSPGESVVRGQDLARILDCSGVVVTATVGETAYNRLRIGDAARFRFRGESTDHQGRVIGLTGIATAPANLAIQPAALSKEPYRVTVALPEFAASGQCDVGRTGRVTFEK